MTHRTPTPEAETDAAQIVPLGVRLAAAWSWRLIVIGVALAAVLWVIVQVRIIVIPLLVAILLTALLRPIVDWVQRLGLPKSVGVLTALLTLFASITALSYLVFTRFRSGFAGLQIVTMRALNEVLEWLESGALGFSFSAEQLRMFVDEIVGTVRNNNSMLWSGALEIGTTVTQVVVGALLAIFALIFFLIDGERIWMWTLGFLPRRAHAGAHAAGQAGWTSVGQYVRVQILVAFVDAVGIAFGAWILGLPLVVPLGILVFLGSFIPFLGAIVTGLIATFVALVYVGPITALIMLGIVVLVNQVEGHILQPLVMGSAVRVHPLGVVVAVSTGALVAGIPGALFAVPIVASLNSMVNVLVAGEWKGKESPVVAYHEQEQIKNTHRNRLRVLRRMRRRTTAHSHGKEPEA